MKLLLIPILLLQMIPQAVFAAPGDVLPPPTDSEVQELEQHGVLPCGTRRHVGTPDEFCSLRHLFILINTLLKFMLFYAALPISVIAFAIIGIKMMTAGDNTGIVKESKEKALSIIIGLAIAFSAWLIVDTFIDALVDRSVLPTVPLTDSCPDGNCAP